MSSWFTGIVFSLCIYTAHSNAAFIYVKQNKFQVYRTTGKAQEMSKLEEKYVASATKQPFKPIINEKFKARAVAMTKSILCGSMVFHCILGTNGMDNPPEKIYKEI
jgi:hypothetical protein